MKDQLFKNKPDINLLNDIIKLYGLNDFNDSKLFTKNNLIDLQTVKNIKEMIPRLNEYYLPCKSKLFLSRIDEKKCITILRQLLKLHNYNVFSKEKCIKGIKYNYYQILPYTNNKINTESNNDERIIVLSFD